MGGKNTCLWFLLWNVAYDLIVRSYFYLLQSYKIVNKCLLNLFNQSDFWMFLQSFWSISLRTFYFRSLTLRTFLFHKARAETCACAVNHGPLWILKLVYVTRGIVGFFLPQGDELKHMIICGMVCNSELVPLSLSSSLVSFGSWVIFYRPFSVLA